MPFIDVDDLLLDPDIAGQTFNVIRTATSVAGGQTQSISTTLPGIVGSVQPASSDELMRLPEGERVSGAITVRTPFALIAGDAANTADIVVFGGAQYTVMSVQDWSAFGAGYVEALASKRTMR